MNTKLARKIVKDNKLNITLRGRTNGLVSIMAYDADDLITFEALLNGYGYSVKTFFADTTFESKEIFAKVGA